MKIIRRAISAAAWAVFFLALDILLKVFRESPADKDDPGIELRSLLGVVYPKDNSQN